MNKSIMCLVGLMIVIFSTEMTTADVVHLTDGSHIRGAIERLIDQKLAIATEFVGTLEIDVSYVKSIQTDGLVNVKKADGQLLIGKIDWPLKAECGNIRTDSGDETLTINEVVMIWPAGQKSPEELAKEKDIKVKQAKWSASIEMGTVVKKGNKEIADARGKVEVRRKSEKNLLRLYASGDYGEENELRSTAEVKGGSYVEHIFNERLFVYASTEAEYDEFENLKLRWTNALGPGYYWIKKDNHELKTRAGIGYQQEEFLDDERTDKTVLDLGLDYRLDITSWLQFTNSTTYYPSLEETRDYRLVSDYALTIPLDISGCDIWKMKFGALYEYNALPSPDFERLDETYYANIVLEIK